METRLQERFKKFEDEQRTKFQKLEKSMNQTISTLLTSATDNFQNSLQNQLNNMSQSMQQMQTTLLAQFQAIQQGKLSDTYNIEPVNMEAETMPPNEKLQHFSSQSSSAHPITQMMMDPSPLETTLASAHSMQNLPLLNSKNSQISNRNTSFYHSQDATAHSSQGGMTP